MGAWWEGRTTMLGCAKRGGRPESLLGNIQDDEKRLFSGNTERDRGMSLLVAEEADERETAEGQSWRSDVVGLAPNLVTSAGLARALLGHRTPLLTDARHDIEQ